MFNDLAELVVTADVVIPKTLDQIITLKRDEASISLASNKAILDLRTSIPEGPEKQVLTSWNILNLRLELPMSSINELRLMGRKPNGRSVITSNLLGIDFDSGLVRTRNSIYGIRGERADEHELDLVFICFLLHEWGLGTRHGVPSFFSWRTA